MRERRVRGTLAYCALLSVMLAASICSSAGAEGPGMAGLVVQYGDGSTETYCVEFTGHEITGYDLLLSTGLEVEASISPGAGAFVCAIGREGCPASDCMCDYPPNYWSYWHLTGEEWTYSQAGASGRLVRSGDVEGWRWGGVDPPELVSFAEVCAPPATETAAPTATWTSSATPAPTETPVPTPTWTPPPSHTPVPEPPTSTPQPSDTPLPTATPTPSPIPPAAPAATATGARTDPASPTPTTQPTHPPPGGTKLLAGASSAASPQAEGEAPSSTPSTSAKADVASATPVPTPLAVAIWSHSAEDVVPTVATAPAASAANTVGSLPALLTVGAGLAYVFFLSFVVVLAGIYAIAKSRRR